MSEFKDDSRKMLHIVLPYSQLSIKLNRTPGNWDVCLFKR